MITESSSSIIARMNPRQIAAMLGGDVAANGSVVCPGPGHSPKDRSLSVTPSDSAPGGFLVHSFAGDDAIQCKDHVREHLHLPQKPNGHRHARARSNGQRTVKAAKPKLGPIIATHDYTDESGELLFQVTRHEPKDFRQRRPDGKGGWINNVDGVPQVPYRLPEVMEALASGYLITIVEGEKDADRLWSIGLPATTNAQGAGKWSAHLSPYFQGANVVVVPDNDDAGRTHRDTVTRSLDGIAQSIRVLTLPDLPPKGDVSDWLDAGGTREELDRLIEAAPVWIASTDTAEVEVDLAKLPPLTLADWAGRDLPPPDFLLGNWLTTTSKALLAAPTGLGKTNFALALGMRIAAGVGFLHWDGRRAARVLYVDGEMSRRLFKERLAYEVARLGSSPTTFFALSREDVETFQPLNSVEGQRWLLTLIDAIGGVDLVILDNIMSLISGSMIEEEPWAQALPLVRALTMRNIGQLWIHHTGHDESRAYGTKTREWLLDTVLHLEEVKSELTDVSFKLSFRKARERTPTTRLDFQDVEIALLNDEWQHKPTEHVRAKEASPAALKFLDALTNVIASDQAVVHGNRRAAKREHWEMECIRLGLLDAAKPDSARALLSKYRRELVAANRVACDGEFSWRL